MALMAFAITDAASREIRCRLESSELEQPIASLLDTSQSFSASEEIVDAISRNASNEEMLAIALKEHREREPILKMRLDVGIYDLAVCPPEYRVEIAGVPFAQPPLPFENCVLDYVEGEFMLRRGEKTYARMVDLLKDEQSAI